MDLCPARTGQVDINSDQGECPLMDTPIGPSVDSFHKAHVGVYKRQGHNLAGRSISLGHGPAKVGKAEKTVEVRNRRGFGVYRIGPHAGRCWSEYMKGSAQ
jgi:hypothetical protein